MAAVIGIENGSQGINLKIKKKKGSGQYAQANFSMTFLVRSDSISEKWSDIRATPNLPQLGKIYQGEGALKGNEADGCRCCELNLKEVSAIQEDGRWKTLWKIEYKFDSEITEMEEDELTGGIGGSHSVPGKKNPEEWPVEVSWESSTQTIPLINDQQTYQPVVTANNEPIHLEYEVPVAILRLTRYEKVHFDGSRILKYLKKTNQNVFLGFGPHHCLIDDITAVRELIHGEYYFKVTYQIAIRDDNDDMPFALQVLHQGTLVLDETDGNIKTTAELLGRNCTVNLHADGRMNTSSFPETLTFHRFGTVDFNELQFEFPENEV